jgi:hypothetical protein
VSDAIGRIDPNQPVADVRALATFVSDDLARPRFAMRLVGGFAVVALFLAAMGLYGVVAFWVARARVRSACGLPSVLNLAMCCGW